MALIACGECNREISTLAKSCPGCGAPPQRTQSTVHTPVTTLPPPVTGSRFEKRITERFMTTRPLDEVKAIVAQRFAQIEPKFDQDTLTYKGSPNTSVSFLRVSLTPIEGGYVLAADHNFPNRKSSTVVVDILLFGLIWYFLNFWPALAVLVVALVMHAARKLTSERIEQCVANLKNELS